MKATLSQRGVKVTSSAATSMVGGHHPGSTGGVRPKQLLLTCARRSQLCLPRNLRRLSSSHMGDLPKNGHGAILLSPGLGEHTGRLREEQHLLPQAVR